MANKIEVVFKGKDLVSGVAGNVKRSIGSIGKAAGGMLGAFKAVGSSVLSLKGALAGIAAGAALKKAVGASAEFEKSLANVSTLGNISKNSMDELKKGVLGLSTEVGRMPVDLVEGLYQTISAGVTAPKQALEVLESSAKLATAGLTDTNTAVDIMTTTLNAYGLEASEATRVSDVLFKTVEQGKTTVGELASTLGVAIPTASSLGISIEELSTAVATLTKGGFSTDVAVTSLNAAMASLIKQSDKFKEKGIDIIDVVGEQGMQGAFKALKDITGGNIKKLQEFVPEQRALRAVLALTGNQFDEYNNILKEVINSTGATEVAFKTQTKTMDSLFDLIKVQLNKVLIQIGEQLFPIVRKFGLLFIDALPKIQKFASAMIKVFSVLPEIITVTAEAMKNIFLRLFTDFSVFKTFLSNFGKMTLALGKAFISLSKEMTFIVLKASSIIWAPLGEAFSVIGGMIRFGLESTIKFMLEKVVGAALSIVEKVNSILPDAFQFDTSGFRNLLTAMSEDVVKPPKAMEEAWAESGEVIKESFDSVSENLSNILDTGKVLFEDMRIVAGEFAESEEMLLLKERLDNLITGANEQGLKFVEETSPLMSDAASETSEVIGAASDKLVDKQQKNLKKTSTALELFREGFKKKWTDTQKDIGTGFKEIGKIAAVSLDSLQKGFSSSIATMIVSGGKFKDVMKNVFISVAQKGLSELIGLALKNIAVAASETFANSFAAASATPVVGPAIAPAVAAASVATMKAAVPAFAEGGIVNQPTLALIGEAGPEAVVPLKGRSGNTGGLPAGRSLTIGNVEIFPNVTVADALLDIPRETLLTWVRRELLPVFEELERSGDMANVTG